MPRLLTQQPGAFRFFDVAPIRFSVGAQPFRPSFAHRRRCSEIYCSKKDGQATSSHKYWPKECAQRLRAPARSTMVKGITPQQQRVIRLVAEGLGNKEIAARLKITPSGAKKHLEALTRRYGVSGRTALVRAAIQAGDLRIRKGRVP